MAFLKNYRVIVLDSSRFEHEECFKINVLSDMSLRCQVRSSLLQALMDVDSQIWEKTRTRLGFESLKRHTDLESHPTFYLSARTLEAMEMALKKAVRADLLKTEQVDLVIIVHLGMNYQAMKHRETGQYVPNWQAAKILADENKDDQLTQSDAWTEIGNRFWERSYEEHGRRVSVGAKIYTRTTITTGGTQSVNYDICNLDDVKNKTVGKWGKLLNSCECRPFDNYCVKGRYWRAGHKPQIEIPYSEDAARFFYETIMALTQLGIKLSDFLGSPDAIENSIQKFTQGNTLPMLT